VDDYVVNTGFKFSILQDGFTIVLSFNVVEKMSDIIWHYSALQGYFRIRYTTDYHRIGFETRSTDTYEYFAAWESANKSPPYVWNQAVLTWNTTQACWYANGVLDACNSDPRTGKRVNYTGFYIGKSYTGNNFQGYISQILVYSRVLSGSEISWNYLYPDNPVKNGLVLWLQADPAYIKDIDNDGILEWIDLSGYGNHGKIYGAQLVQLVKTPARTLTPARILTPAR
jgi:hypothetical protein